MPRDAQDHALTVASEDTARAYDRAIEGYLAYRADTGQRLAALLAADPEFGMGQVLKGYLALTPFDAAFLPRAREALAGARRHAVAHVISPARPRASGRTPMPCRTGRRARSARR